jgi:hypothetical protein
MGMDELRSQIQPGEMIEQISSQVDQQMQLTEEESENDILMIGGIKLFLPFSRRRQKIVLQMVQHQNSHSWR